MAFGRPSEKDDRREQRTREWLQKQNGLAVASFVVGLFGLIEFGAIPLFGPAAITLAIMAMRQLKHPTDQRTQGRGLAVAGMILGAASLVASGVLYLPRLIG